jgi:Integrase zinc binding domain
LESARSEINSVSYESELCLNLKLIAKKTKSEEFLHNLFRCILNGWKVDQVESQYKRFFSNSSLLSIEEGCILYNGRVVIPNSLKSHVLKLLHSNHDGIVRMKRLARTYVFWKGIDFDIENYVESCKPCQPTKEDSDKKIYGKWPSATYPFQRVHLDFFYFESKQYLILIDAYSRWMDIKAMKNLTIYCLTDTLNEFIYHTLVSSPFLSRIMVHLSPVMNLNSSAHQII